MSARGRVESRRDFRGPVVRQMHDAVGAAHGHLSFHEFVNIKGGNEGAAGGSFAGARQVWQDDHVLAGEQIELLTIAQGFRSARNGNHDVPALRIRYRGLTRSHRIGCDLDATADQIRVGEGGDHRAGQIEHLQAGYR